MFRGSKIFPKKNRKANVKREMRGFGILAYTDRYVRGSTIQKRHAHDAEAEAFRK
jgi:hypothetical protein